MKTIKFGIIGCGLMGREFASAVGRWMHLLDAPARPEIVAVCDLNVDATQWFADSLPTITQVTDDYHALLANPDVEAVYCAVPHNLHAQFYCDIISAGKHLLGEKPFGIDLAANEQINACIAAHPDVLVRCSSEFPFWPAVQRIGKMLDKQAFGQLIEVNTGFMHSSDLNVDKAINWKRMIAANGEYGCMGDLGMHACHVPFRAGFVPLDVRAVLSNLVPTRPDKTGTRVPCETWDNATLLTRTKDTRSGDVFPWTVKTQRIAPGETDTWYIEVKGMKACARFSTTNPRRLEVLEYTGGDQAWQQIDLGYETAFKTITGGIFEFGFSDGILQMWASFVAELAGVEVPTFAGCVRPEEAALSHRLFTAALTSEKNGTTEKV